ncbi:UDP-Glycosyltransferase superfamily protein [Striga asiatica]|uniref:Glycosyltransferase n=1 Tax=Striga asiatica TaxID=4170 RepID=A0A5A7QGD3_STRAF|nr:UDP-Glycosyltransferase superfamily protein [Striga asiatica]
MILKQESQYYLLTIHVMKKQNNITPRNHSITMEKPQTTSNNNAHILAIPFPLQGHINPMLQFCNRLSSKGVRVTFVTTVSVSKTLQTKPGEYRNVETVPDSTAVEAEGLDVYEIYIRNFRAAISSGLPDIIDKYRDSGFPVNAIVYDSVIPWVLDVAHEKGVKGAVLLTQSCTVFAVFHHVHEGNLVISPDGGSGDVSLPGMPVMGVRDLPSLAYDKDSYPTLARLVVEQFSTFGKADWRLFNTFDKLENEILKWMATIYPIHTIGPTVPSMYADKRVQGNYDYGLSLFKPKTESWSEWIDKKEAQSIIYVSFGSLADLSETQMEEIARGLILTKCSFIWVVRETEQHKLPQDIISSPELSENCLIVNWCSQLEILSHPSVGCFVTHGGWNSTLEALTLGVPMVVVPQWTDQTTNAKFVRDVWRVGVCCVKNGDGIVSREQVRDCVNEVMKGERGIEIRGNVRKWKDLAVEAVSEGGSSDKNIGEIVMGLV